MVSKFVALATGAAVLVALLVLGWLFGGFIPLVRFKPLDLTTLASSLAPLIVVAVLIERSIEVFFGIWREPDNRKVETRIQLAEEATKGLPTPEAAARVAAAGAIASGASAAVRADTMAQAAAELAAAEKEAAERKATNTWLAFLTGGILGILVALGGLRVLESTLAPPGPGQPGPGRLFQAMDVFLTAGLLGGGADGFHRIMNVFTTFMESSEKRAADAGKRGGT